MQARVTMSGGGNRVRHWQLYVDGAFIADTATPQQRDRFIAIAAAINGPVTL